MLGRAFPWENFNFLIFLFSALCFYEIFLWFWIQNWEHCLRFWGFFFCFLSSSLHMLVTKMEIISIATLLKMKYLCLYSSLKWKCYSSRTLLCLDLGSAQCEEPGALKKKQQYKIIIPHAGFSNQEDMDQVLETHVWSCFLSIPSRISKRRRLYPVCIFQMSLGHSGGSRCFMQIYASGWAHSSVGIWMTVHADWIVSIRAW